MVFDLIELNKAASFRLAQPKIKKLFSLGIGMLTDEARESIPSLINTPIVKRANPFVQYNNRNIVLIEFWTDNEEAILTAALFLQNSLS